MKKIFKKVSRTGKTIKYRLHNKKLKSLLVWGLNNGFIFPYDETLIKKLRNIYYGGIPASIILLSDAMSNGYCYDRALLLAQAFLDEEDDIRLIYADVNSLKLDPENNDNNDELDSEHCFLERITKNGEHIIYDTSAGFIYDKDIYWLIEKPKVRRIVDKQSISEFIKQSNEIHPEDIESDKYCSALILPFIEQTYGRPTEMYSAYGIELLQREIEHFKKRLVIMKCVRKYVQYLRTE